jgi:hypothetical protein
MNRIFFTVILSSFFLMVKAQESSDIPDPEFINQVYLLDKDKKLQKLEKKDAEITNKSKAIGMGGARQVYIMEGAKSEVVVPAGDMTFVISTGGSGFASDPSSMLTLYKFEGKKNKRETTAASYGGIGNKGKSKGGENEIPLNYKKMKEGVFGIVPEKALEKGEYAFINKMSMQGGGMSMKMEAFAFSVE